MEPTLQIFGQVARNRQLCRVVGAYALFIVAEYITWIGMLVYAFGHGGATAAGLVALAQLLPSVVVAPLLATWSDRRSPAVLLAGGYTVTGAFSVGTAAAIFAGSPYVAYVCAVVAGTALSTTRPAQAALVPALTREVSELTAANALIGWVESVGIAVAGAAVGLVLALTTVAFVFVAGAVLLAVAVLLVAPLRAQPTGAPSGSGGTLGLVADAAAQVWRNPPARLLVGLLGAEDVVIGALDVLFVVLAIDVLQAGQAWVGYLNMAFGVGGVVLGSLGAFLVGRRLGPVILGAALLLALALAATSIVSGPLAAAVLLAVVGGSRSLFEVGTRALLQRTVAANMVARIFGLAEGLSMAGLALGSVLAPALVALGGGRLALVGVSAILPVIVVVRGRLLMRLDEHARVPVVEIALLRSLPLFRILPAESLEGLAHALEREDYDTGAEIVREGDEGDRYFAIVEGDVEIRRGGRPIGMLGRGDGLGEIALLRGVRRTATAVAASPATVYALDRESFLAAVNGHVPTLHSALDLAREVQARDARRESP